MWYTLKVNTNEWVYIMYPLNEHYLINLKISKSSYESFSYDIGLIWRYGISVEVYLTLYNVEKEFLTD